MLVEFHASKQVANLAWGQLNAYLSRLSLYMPHLLRCLTIFFVSALSLLTLPAFAQMDVELAKQYYSQGEFEKAAELYDKLFTAQPRNEYYLTRYIESLLQAKLYDDAEKAIKKAIKDNPTNMALYVQRGLNYEAQGEMEKADKTYAEALKKLPAERFAVQKLANAFSRAAKYKNAVAAYERGGELLKDETMFAYNLGALYQQLNDEEKMVRNYLLALRDKPMRLGSVQSILSRYLDEEGYRRVQSQILLELQGAPENETLTELLVWTYIQQKDFRSAMRQVRALDMRRQEDGQRIYRLAITALNERQYAAAKDGFDYIIRTKGERNPYYIDAKKLGLQAERERLLSASTFDKPAFEALEAQYVAFLGEMGLNTATAPLARELAMLQVNQLGKRDEAIKGLEAILEFPTSKEFAARTKLDLGDFYLMEGERWEATLLYSQVDKAFPEGVLGHEARFRNARLSYYSSDFEWAQEQFDILKSSTSRLIANDAIDMSVFIMDNLNLDTTAVPLSMYAASELLGFQSQFDAAFAKLDSLVSMFPENGLLDDVLYARANLYRKQGQFTLAAEFYRKVLEAFPEEIRADNALFALAEITERQLGDEEAAKALYERLFLEYDNSILAVEARKRFRRLRGDELG